MSDAHRDAIQDEFYRRYGDAPISYEQYKLEVLATADENGKLYPPSLVEWQARFSWLMKMFFERLIESDSRHDEPMRWRITDAGRAASSSDAS